MQSRGETCLIFFWMHTVIRGLVADQWYFIQTNIVPNELRVAGVIAGYPTPEQSWQPIVDHKGTAIMDQKGKPIGYIQENPGIVVATDIKHALELIDANPIGLPLPAGKD